MPDVSPIKYNKWIKNTELPKTGVLYRGVVVDNVDPEKFGRIKVLIEGLTPAQAPEGKAVWAWTLNVFGGGQESGLKYGSYFPYPIGAKVFVLFEPSFETTSNPVVIGGWYQQDQKPIEAYDRYETDKPIPNAWGYQSPNGLIIQCREEKDHYQIECKTPGNRKLVISDQTSEEVVTLLGAKGNEITIYEGSKGTRIQILDQNGNTLLFDTKNNNIILSCKENLILKAKNITLISEEDISNISGEDLVLTGAKKVTLQGNNETQIGNSKCLTQIEGNIINEEANTINLQANAVNIISNVTVTGSIAVI